jgi:CRISPR/Cas system-associated exonuclease Cas4 (RecB family)
LLVRTSPAGARVKVDGNDRGVSPLTLRDLALREYAVEVSRTGYAPETRRIRLTERQPTRSLEIALRAASAGAAAASPPGRASLELATRPPGARVYVDGQLIGTTPLRMVDVAPGTKAVSFELTGYAKWTATVTIAPGEPRKVSASLEPLP